MVDRSVAGELDPEAIAFLSPSVAVPPSPIPRSACFRDARRLTAAWSASRSCAAIGLLSLIPPLITNFLVSSVIPRTEIDQLIVCAAALVVTGVSVASLQVVQGVVMLRLEGLIDFKLQAALIDRLLRLPAGLFRNYTTGDLVDRSMGIDAIRRISPDARCAASRRRCFAFSASG